MAAHDFRTGMHEYLTKLSYKNASTEDLWASLGVASGKPVDKVMTTWTKKMGYPVLNVSAKQSQEGSSRHITISQTKFCADGCDKPYKDYLWMVPVTIATKNNKSAASIPLETKTSTVTIDNIDPNDWVKVNPGSVGFYRVNYQSDMLAGLLQAVSDGSLDTRDRIQLIDDVLALAQAGVGSTVKVLELLSAYANEKEFTVWETLIGSLGTLNRLLSNTDYHDKFKKFAENIFTNIVKELGWEPRPNEGPLIPMMRSMLLSAYGHYGNSNTISQAKSKFDNHVCDKETCHVDLRSTVFSLAMKHGNEETFDQLCKLHSKSASQEESVRLYRAMGYGQTSPLCKLVKKTRGHVIPLPYRTKSELKIVVHYLPQLLTPARQADNIDFASEERAKEVEEFFTANPAASVERTVKQSCEAIRLHAQWLGRDKEAIKEWLNSKS
ncbi:puromycin-sensitive aminopeptidase-like [Dysidea avara]|uniref:puromycin-sensitive aminopeptidase-like n=1 Tax=Dysidea avara TaxID=196820 RepID=UPI00332C70EE